MRVYYTWDLVRVDIDSLRLCLEYMDNNERRQLHEYARNFFDDHGVFPPSSFVFRKNDVERIDEVRVLLETKCPAVLREIEESISE